jgi:hypothetical protein
VRSRRAVWFALLIFSMATLIPVGRVDAQDADAEATIAALQTQVAELSPPAATPPAASAENEAAEPDTTPTPAPTSKVVNVELILDVSGSMAQIIDTGEIRMEVAKRVLNQVLATVPTKPGINVGLRIYGHLGDNSEAGRPISCQASDLVVPVSGVDREVIA